MVRIQPVKSLIPVEEHDTLLGSLPSSRIGPPNRFRSQSYDRSVFGHDDCTKETGSCKCHMCCNTPLVILPSGNAICNHYNITLRNVQEFLDGGLLQPLCEKSLMIYCQTKTDGTCQVGIFAAIDAADCMDRTVRPHENVTADVDKTTANAKHPYMNPIMLFHRDSAPLNEIIERIMLHDRPHQKKVSDITDEIHTIWIVNDVNDIVAIQNAFVDIKHLYIADGHHRTAALCRESLRLSSGRAVNVPQSSRYLTALIFPDSQLSVLAFNRCVRTWPAGLTHQALIEQISQRFDVHPISNEEYFSSRRTSCSSVMQEQNTSAATSSSTRGAEHVRLQTHCDLHLHPQQMQELELERDVELEQAYRKQQEHQEQEQEGRQVSEQRRIQMYVAGQWYLLEAHPIPACEDTNSDANPLSCVGSQILLEQLLRPILQVDNPYSEEEMIYVDGREGVQGVQRIVDSGKASVGFVLHALSTAQIMRVADAGLLLPAKATFFDPKPMSNLLLRLLR